MVSDKALSRPQTILSLLLTAVIVAGTGLFYFLGLFDRPDHVIYDLNYIWRGSIPTSGRIVLVLMDERSAEMLGRRRGVWSRTQLAEAVRNLSRAGAAVIGIDLVLAAPDPDPEADRALAEAIREANNVILARVSGAPGGEIVPLPRFGAEMIGDGFIDLPTDSDDVLRRIRYLTAKPLPDGNLELLPAFSLELARTFLNAEFTFDFSDNTRLIVGAAPGPVLRLPYPDLMIHYYGNEAVFSGLSYGDVVQDRFGHEAIRGKLVIIGSNLSVQKDFFVTPFSRAENIIPDFGDTFGTLVGGFVGQKAPGVACHAHAAETILNGHFVRKLPATGLLAGCLAAGIVGLVFYLPAIGTVIESAILAVGLLCMVGSAYLLFLNRLIWVETAPLILIFSLQFVSGIGLQKGFERKRKNRVTRLFGRYVSPRVVDELIRGDIDSALEGRRVELTILFSDIRGFTTLSEKLGARETARMLNTYFDVMIPIIFTHQGTLDKLMGDAIMAFFGAPLSVPDHPRQAAESALEMIAQTERLEMPEKLEAGFGINTDTVTVGNLGSQEFMDYTVIGDGVNLASRLEGLNKVYGTRILIAGSTADRLDDRFLLRRLDRVRVKGKENAVSIFELMGYREQVSEREIDAAKRFERGVDAFGQRQWDTARTLFTRVLEAVPGDGPSRLYLERIDHFRKFPPEDDWEGITLFDSK